MRKTLIASSLAVVALGGLAGSIASASGSGADPAAPPDTTPGLDALSELGIDAEALQCIVENFGSADVTDMSAMTELIDQCGISLDQLMQLLQIGDETVATVENVIGTVGEATATTEVGEATVPPDIDAATAAAALEALGLDEASVDCLVTEAATATPDDAGAGAAFDNCGVGPAQLLDAIVALDAAASGTDAAPPTTAVDDVVPTSAASSGSEAFDIVIETLESAGIELEAEQEACLQENVEGLDPTDITAITALLETCGILPGG
jgi:hypothetical protein